MVLVDGGGRCAVVLMLRGDGKMKAVVHKVSCESCHGEVEVCT